MKTAKISSIRNKTFYYTYSYVADHNHIFNPVISIRWENTRSLNVLPALYRIQLNASISIFWKLLKDAISCICLEMILLEGRGTYEIFGVAECSVPRDLELPVEKGFYCCIWQTC